MDYNDFREHIGHKIVCVCYGEDGSDPENIALECETCGCVLMDVHKDEHYEKHGLECPSCECESEYIIETNNEGKEVYYCYECGYQCIMFRE